MNQSIEINSVKEKRPIFDNIQYMRAAAAIAVAVSHIWLLDGLGGIGVSVFFVISGFIMITTSWNNFGKPNASWNFLIRRFARIMIPWWICLSIKIWMDSRQHPLLWIFSSYALLPIPDASGTIGPIHGVGWSLVWEMIFYYAFSLSLLFHRKIGISVTVVVFVLISIIGYMHPTFQENNWHGGFIFLLFASGMLIGAARKSYAHSKITPYVAISIAIGMTYFAYTSRGFANFNVYIGMAAILAIGGMVFARNLPPANFLLRTIHFLGDASFAIYITHTIVIRAVIKIFSTLKINHFSQTEMMLQCFISLLVGSVFYRYVEFPINKFMHGYLKK